MTFNSIHVCAVAGPGDLQLKSKSIFNLYRPNAAQPLDRTLAVILVDQLEYNLHHHLYIAMKKEPTALNTIVLLVYQLWTRRQGTGPLSSFSLNT